MDNNTIQKEIASSVKDMREVCEISVQEMSEKLDVPVETYTKYESGEIDIPASILYEASIMFIINRWRYKNECFYSNT